MGVPSPPPSHSRSHSRSDTKSNSSANSSPENGRRLSSLKRKGSPFVARSSKLDLERLEKDQHEFRGFFVLFWMAMSIYVILTFVRNYENHGVLFGSRLFKIFSADGLVLIITDFVMILSTFSSFFIHKLIVWRVFRRKYIGRALQHLSQTLFLGVFLSWIYHRDFKWVQTGFLTLHTMTMLMKMHSYSEYNGELSEKLREVEQLKLREAQLLKKDEVDGDDQELIQVHMLIEELEADLKPLKVRYPENVTFMNFVDYLLCPTLVYELEYPRTENIRIPYVVEKSLATLGTFGLMYITVEHYIIPVMMNMKNISFVSCLLQLLFPFMVCYLMVFYIIFECIANAFAELSRFADREFYSDWWNSSSFDQFARKWNKPVHEFLLRHIYLESINTYKLSKQNATFVTFFMSSCLHELAMMMVARRMRFYLFVLQMLQIPLIWMGRHPWVRKRPVLGNAFFWFSMFCGPPLLAACYIREHVLHDS